jgi:hypothetical protein
VVEGAKLAVFDWLGSVLAGSLEPPATNGPVAKLRQVKQGLRRTSKGWETNIGRFEAGVARVILSLRADEWQRETPPIRRL